MIYGAAFMHVTLTSIKYSSLLASGRLPFLNEIIPQNIAVPLSHGCNDNPERWEMRINISEINSFDLFLKTQFFPRSKHFFSRTKISQFCTVERVDVCSDIYEGVLISP